MIWLWEVGILLVLAFVLRRLLGIGRQPAPAEVFTTRRTPQIEPIYKRVATEIETHSTILAVSLNDAFEENKARNVNSVGCLVNIFAGEWTRLTELVEDLQQLSLRYLPLVDLPVPVRTLDPECFRSGSMVEFVRFNGFLDQFVFRPKLRFQLHLKLQSRAIVALSEEFQRTRSDMQKSPQFLAHGLAQLDLYFHDLDRLAKETLLAFRAELSCLPGHAIPDIGAELEELVSEGVTKPLAAVNQ